MACLPERWRQRIGSESVSKGIEVGTVRSKDGTPIGYVKTGRGPSVVFVHGALTTGATWVPVGEALGERFMSYIMDRRGRGQSGDGTEYSVDSEVEDIEAVLGAAGPGAHLVGHSSGAIYALEAALRGSIGRLILYEPPLHYQAFEASGALDRMRSRVEEGRPEDAVVIFAREELQMGEEQLADLRTRSNWEEMVALASTFVREWDAVFDAGPKVERYRGVGSPTLLLTGSETAAHPSFATQALRSVMLDVRQATLEGHGHRAHLAAPDLVAEEIRRFLLS